MLLQELLAINQKWFAVLNDKEGDSKDGIFAVFDFGSKKPIAAEVQKKHFEKIKNTAWFKDDVKDIRFGNKEEGEDYDVAIDRANELLNWNWWVTVQASSAEEAKKLAKERFKNEKNLNEGALVNQSNRKARANAAFAKETTKHDSTYEALSPQKRKRVDLAISGARKIAKVSGATPLAVLRHYMGGDNGGSPNVYKFMYSDADGKSSPEPKSDDVVMKLTGASEAEINAMILLDYKDEAVVARAKLKVVKEDLSEAQITVGKGWKKVKSTDPDYHQYEHEAGHEVRVSKKGVDKEYQGPMGMMGRTHTSRKHHMMTRKAGTDNWEEYGHVSPYEVSKYANSAFYIKEE